jgi:hypothetical protein
MPTLFQGIQGFAGASGVGILCLVGLFFIVSVFATNLPYRRLGDEDTSQEGANQSATMSRINTRRAMMMTVVEIVTVDWPPANASLTACA